MPHKTAELGCVFQALVPSWGPRGPLAGERGGPRVADEPVGGRRSEPPSPTELDSVTSHVVVGAATRWVSTSCSKRATGSETCDADANTHAYSVGQEVDQRGDDRVRALRGLPGPSSRHHSGRQPVRRRARPAVRWCGPEWPSVHRSEPRRRYRTRRRTCGGRRWSTYRIAASARDLAAESLRRRGTLC